MPRSPRLIAFVPAARLISLTKLGHGPGSSSSSMGVLGSILSSAMFTAPLGCVESRRAGLAHFNVPAGTLLRTLLAPGAELQLDSVRLPRGYGLLDGSLLAVLPAGVALEAHPAGQAPLGLGDGLLRGEAQIDLAVGLGGAFVHRDRGHR